MKAQFITAALLSGGLLATTGCRPSATSETIAKSGTSSAKNATKTAPEGSKSQMGATKTPPPKVEAGKTSTPSKATQKKETGHKTEKATLKDFPKDIALYQGAKVLGVGKSAKGAVAGLETKDAPQKVMDYYARQLPAQGWTVKSSTTTKQGGVLQGAKNKRQCIVTVGVNPKTKLTTFSLMAF